ncbi:MAG: NERD domain-containing protein [Firmicutes bacterium]|nr:NERD domain-containing protein [Bacillota bacterium]
MNSAFSFYIFPIVIFCVFFLIIPLLYILYLFIIYKSQEKEYLESTYYKITHTPFRAMRTDSGKYGEYLIYHYLKNYENKGAKFLFNCYLPRENEETTEIDVLMIHKSGIYVFESKNYSGWIFGNENNKTWTQTLPSGRKSHKEHFLNPIMQNKLHIKWLKEIIGNEYPIYSIIVFSERCTLKKIELKSNSIKVIKRKEVVNTVNQIDESCDILNEEKIAEINDKLYSYTQITETEKEKHIENIINRNPEIKNTISETSKKSG